jgi:hypothetical protein
MTAIANIIDWLAILLLPGTGRRLLHDELRARSWTTHFALEDIWGRER